MIRRFDLCRWSVPDDLEEALMVEPVDPFKGCELHRLQTSPGPSRANHLRLVQLDDRLGQGVVIRIANAPHRLLVAGLGQAFGVADGQILRSAVPVMDQAIARSHRALVQGLLERVERQIGAKRVRDPPTHDAPGEGVDDERDIDEPGPGRQWSKKQGVVGLFPCFSSPNRTCALPRIRLSIRERFIATATSTLVLAQ